MTEKELKKLSRMDLLKLLMLQTKENERLQAELDAANAKLADRTLRVNRAGSIAKAALEINGVMEAAQAAAQQYLDNIKLVEAETRRKSALLLAELEEKIQAAQQREAAAAALMSSDENR